MKKLQQRGKLNKVRNWLPEITIRASGAKQPFRGLSGCIRCWFPQCVANPITFVPENPCRNNYKLFVLFSCPKFSVAA